MTTFSNKMAQRSENDVNTPTFVFDDGVPWQMSRWERYTLDSLVRSINPVVSIEIGRYKGGSLQVLSKYSKTVYSIDIDNSNEAELSNIYKNVKFINGKSSDVIGETLKHFDKTGANFVLIDGDHSEEGVFLIIFCRLKESYRM